MWETRRQIRSNEETANSLEEGDEKRGHRELVRRKIRGWRKWVDDERREVWPLWDEDQLFLHRPGIHGILYDTTSRLSPSKNTLCYQGGWWGEGIVREFGIDVYTLVHLKWITNKELYNTGNCAQCYVAAWMGGDFEGEWVCVELNPFAVPLKLSQHC